MDGHFLNLFDATSECTAQDPEDEWFLHVIPQVKVDVLRKVVERDIGTIRNSHISDNNFLQFKMDLLAHEAKWGERVYDWTYIPSYRRPFGLLPSVDRATRYFQVWMSLQNSWSLLFPANETATNLWNYIPRPPHAKKARKSGTKRAYCADDACYYYAWQQFDHCPTHLMPQLPLEKAMAQFLVLHQPNVETIP